MTSEEYGQYIDDFEMGIDVDPTETLTQYIERRRREFESKADGGSIGIEVLFGPKRDEFSIGGNVQRVTTPQPYDPRASVADFARAIDKVGGGTDLQKAIDIDRYGKNIQRQNMLNRIQKMNPAGTGNFLQGIKDFGQHAMVSEAMAGKTGKSVIPQYGFQTGYDFQKKFTGLDPKISAGLAAAYQTLQEGSRALLDGPGGITLGQAMKTAQQQATENMEGILAADTGTITPEQQAARNEYLKSQGQSTDADVAGPAKTFTPDSEGYAAYEGIVPGFTARKRSDGRFEYKAPDGQVYGPDTYMSIAAGAYPNIYDPNKQTLADGGRVPMVSGGALKGIMNLFKRGGDDAVDLAKQEEIFRKGPITKEFLETVDSKVISPFVRTRDAKGVGSYGLYDNFDDMPAGLKAAEIIKRFVNRKTGEINYDAAEFFIGRKLKGDETINELIDIAISKPIGMGKGPLKDFEEYVLNPAKKADGGRVGLFMGGPALTGEALSIYNSMSAYGFSDQEIANALAERGLYTPGGTTEETEIIASAPNIINQQTSGDGPNIPPGPTFNRNDLLGTSDYQGTGPGIVSGFKDAIGDLVGLYQKFSPFGIVSKFVKDRAEKQQELQDNAVAKAEAERKAKEAIAEAERKERERAAQYGATNYGKGVGGQSYSGDAVGAPGLGFGVGATTGGPVSNRTGRGRQDYSKGGLATMFTRRR